MTKRVGPIPRECHPARSGYLALALAVLLTSSVNAADNFGNLLKRIPETGNALALIDVDGLLNSPMGKRDNWKQMIADRPTGVLGVSMNASKVAISARVDLRSLEDQWKIGMVETRSAAPSLSVLAEREGGFVEQIETQNVAWTPRNLILFSFEPRIIGFVAPAERQELAQWIKNVLIKPRTFPKGWYDLAVNRANAGSQIVLAVNLKNAISPIEVEAWTKAMDDVKKYRLDPKVLGMKLAGVTSVLFEVDVTETIKGTIRIEFDGDVSYAQPAAKELLMAALDSIGAHVEDLDKWSASTDKNTMTLSGRMEVEQMTRFTRFLSIPHLNGLEDRYLSQSDNPPSNPAQPAPAIQATDDDVVKASQRYFRTIVDLVNKLKGQKAQSFTIIRQWMNRTAGEIDELPILNVDTDLLQWGSKISYSLREMGYNINYSNKNRQYALANSPKGSYVGWGGGYTYTGMDDRLAKTSSNAVLNVDLDGRWQAIQVSIAETRKALVAKYKVDF